MNIERELLKRVISGTDDGVDFFIGYRLYKDIETFLAQPEQTEHWKETLIEHFQTAFDSEMYRTDEGEELILLEDAICYVEEFTPPKREPLSTKQAEDLWETTFKSAVPYYIFDEICGAIEQYHGIGGGE